MPTTAQHPTAQTDGGSRRREDEVHGFQPSRQFVENLQRILVAREGSDIIAERMRALDAVPDGRSDTVVATTSLPRFPANEHNTTEVVDRITTRIYATVETLRRVHDAVDAEDPTTADILHAQIDGLEKLAWLIKSENRKV
jgi:starvation-inducible DNA-binding protein